MGSAPRAKHPRPAARRGEPEARARRQALTEWRRVDLEPLETARRVAERPVGVILPGVLESLRLEQRLAESSIIQVWNRTLDPLLSAHAQPVGLHQGTLFVKVDSNVWLSELVRYRRHEILERLQLAVGRETVVRISFRLG
ncbi:MAG: DUF721 domain-containing protein [Verrucomicrobiota bacterium]